MLKLILAMDGATAQGWKYYEQVPSSCSHFHTDSDLTWCFKRNVGPKLLKITNGGCIGIIEEKVCDAEEVVHILQYNDPYKDHSVIYCTEEVKEEFKELMKQYYPKNRRLAISANRHFWTSYDNRINLVIAIFEELMNKSHSTIYLFEDGAVYELAVKRYIQQKLNRECPCCHDRGNVGARGRMGPRGDAGLSELAEHKGDCACCKNKKKPVFDTWRPASFLRKL